MQLAFVASKKVGNAVQRARAKRRIRALILSFQSRIKPGKYIFVAKDKIFDKSPKELEKDFKVCYEKLE